MSVITGILSKALLGSYTVHMTKSSQSGSNLADGTKTTLSGVSTHQSYPQHTLATHFSKQGRYIIIMGYDKLSPLYKVQKTPICTVIL